MHNLHTEEHYFDRWIKKKKKRKHGSTVRVKIIIRLLRAVVQNWNFDLSAGNIIGKLTKFRFSMA